jgi:hypothetical protein
MNKQLPLFGGAVLGAGGLGYWLSGPALVASVLLGSAAACGCDPRLSDFSEHWAHCAVANAAIHDKLDLIFEGVDGKSIDITVSQPPEISAEQSKLLAESVNPNCGSFDEARAADLSLQVERKNVGYDELRVPESFQYALYRSQVGYEYLTEQGAKSSKALEEAPDA